MKKKLIFIILLVMSLLLQGCISSSTNFWGLTKVESQVPVSIYNNSSKDVNVEINISVSPRTPTFGAIVKSGEDKEIIIDWDKVRKQEEWVDGTSGVTYSCGSGNIYANITYNIQNESIYLGAVDLWQDGKNYVTNSKII